MRFRPDPDTNTILFSIEPGDLVALVDARDNDRVLSSIYEFPENERLAVMWIGPPAEVVAVVYTPELEIACRFPQTHSLHLVAGDVFKLYAPGGIVDVFL
jgi:hypothetical protein